MATTITSAANGEFEPTAATQQLIETVIPWSGRAAAAATAALLFACLIWMVLAKVDVIVSTTGVLVPLEGIHVIQPSMDGTLRAIHVRDGQQVRAGSVLVELDPTPYLAELERIGQERLLVSFDVARFTAMLEANSEESIVFPQGTRASDEQLQMNRLKSEVEQHRHLIATLDAQVRKIDISREIASQEREKLRENVQYLQEKVRSYDPLVLKGLMAKRTALDAQHTLDEAARDLHIQELVISRLTTENDALLLQKRQTIDEYRARIYSGLNDAKQKEIRLSEELSKAQVRYQHANIISPVDGIVQQLAVRTIGAVVKEAQPLMTVVPILSALQVDARVDNRDAGYVRSQQRADIKVDAFEFTNFGVWHGTVDSVSSDTVYEQRLDRPEATNSVTSADVGPANFAGGSHYVARIYVDPKPSYRESVGDVRLKAGMTVHVDISVGQRRVIEYFLVPFAAATHRPFSAQ